MDELPEKLADQGSLQDYSRLLEKRRHHIREQIGREHPEVLEGFRDARKSWEQRLEKQNPEARRLRRVGA